LAVLITLAAAGLILIFASPRHRRDAGLPDGSRLVVEKVRYGKLEPFQYGGWRQRLKQHLPQALVSRFFKATPGSVTSSSWVMNTTIHASNDALYVYITRRDADTGDYMDTGMRRMSLVDEHGCEFPSTQAGGEDDGRLTTSAGSGSSVGWFRFEAFPRHEKSFRMLYFGQDGKVQAEFVLSNPAPPPAQTNDWVTEPLPITKSNGDVSFKLTSLTIATNGLRFWTLNPRGIAPKYEVREHGEISANWRPLNIELYDSSGNFASEMAPDSRFLCTNEAAWKLRVKFFGSEQSPSASNATWTLRGLSVPAAGKFNVLSGSQELQGVEVKAVAFAGAGSFQYSNNVPLSGALPTEQIKQSSMDSAWYGGPRGSQFVTRKVKSKTPHLCIKLGVMTEDQRFTARATDDQGREFYGYELHQYATTDSPAGKPGEINYLDRGYHNGDDFFVAFDLPDDAKTVDVTFCVHSCFAPEFIFKPPTGMEPDAPATDAANDTQKDTNQTAIFMGKSEGEGHIVHK
jgi:hypothetical protein